MIVFFIMFAMLSIAAVSVIYSNVDYRLKTVLIPMFIFGSICSFLTLQEYLGKPVRTSLIPRAVMVYGQLVDKENGRIFILCQEEGQPLPAKYVEYVYNENLHEALNKGKAVYGGEPFELTAEEPEGEGDGEPGEKGNKNDGDSRSLSVDSAEFHVHDLPSPIMPEKFD